MHHKWYIVLFVRSICLSFYETFWFLVAANMHQSNIWVEHHGIDNYVVIRKRPNIGYNYDGVWLMPRVWEIREVFEVYISYLFYNYYVCWGVDDNNVILWFFSVVLYVFIYFWFTNNSRSILVIHLINKLIEKSSHEKIQWNKILIKILLPCWNSTNLCVFSIPWNQHFILIGVIDHDVFDSIKYIYEPVTQLYPIL